MDDLAELSDLELLASAGREALAAYETGALLGPLPTVGELARVARRARQQDAARTFAGGEAA